MDYIGYMKNIHITEQTLPEITMAIQVALDAKKEYQICITAYDKSLHARQRALACIWYGQIETALGEAVGYAEAYCKLHWGLGIRCRHDKDRGEMFNAMLDGHSYEDKLKIIIKLSDMFPVLRAKGGLCVEGQAEYLQCIQRHFAEQGVILTSPRDDDLLYCREANK